MIQVDELEAGLVEDVAQAGLVEHELGVAAMALALGDDDLASPPPPENLGDRAHTAGCVLIWGASTDGSTRLGFKRTDRPFAHDGDRPSSRKPA